MPEHFASTFSLLTSFSHESEDNWCACVHGGTESASPAASNSGGVESRLRVAAEIRQHLFPAAPDLCRVKAAPRRGSGNWGQWRGIAESYAQGVESGLSGTKFRWYRACANHNLRFAAREDLSALVAEATCRIRCST